MLLQFPILFYVSLQQVVLVLNTVLLISILIVAELVYAEKPPEARRHIRDFYPVVAVVIGLLGIAIYRQIGMN